MNTKRKTPSETQVFPPALSRDIAKALENIGEAELRALIFGYLAGKGSASEKPAPTSFELAPDPLAHYRPTAELSFEDAVAFAPASLDTEMPAAEGTGNVPGNVIQCIFAVFSRQGIPISTATVPSAIMAKGNWFATAQAIYACVVRTYPQFAQYATPTSPERFYNATLEQFATAIINVINK